MRTVVRHLVAAAVLLAAMSGSALSSDLTSHNAEDGSRARDASEHRAAGHPSRSAHGHLRRAATDIKKPGAPHQMADANVQRDAAATKSPPGDIAAQSHVNNDATLIPGLPDGMVASVIGLQRRSNSATAAGAASTAPKRLPGSGPSVADHQPATETTAAVAQGSTPAQQNANPPAPADCLRLIGGLSTGVAMYRRATATIVVVDRSVAVDVESAGEWWHAHRPQVAQTAEWTTLLVPTAKNDGVRIERRTDGLCLTGTSDLPPSHAVIPYRSRSDAISFGLARPSHNVTVVDPVTHALLLVGTDAGTGGALHPSRRSALFTIDESIAGVVVEPLSDRLDLRRTADGFDLVADGAASLHMPPGFTDVSLASVDGLTRTLTLSAAPIDALKRQLREKQLAAAVAPLRARSERRLDLAETMAGLGMGSEARSVVLTAVADDPSAAASPRAALLAGIAALLDKPARGGDAFASPSFPATEEGKLWRALAWAPPAPVDAAVATIRRGLPLLLSYPQKLRDAAAGRAADVLLASDDPDALHVLDLLPDTEQTRLARARAAARLGRPADALSMLTPLTRSRDLGIMAASLRETARLQLGAHQLTAEAAANLLAAHRLDWRITGQETAALLDEADDRLLVPDLRAAFALWHDAVTADPSIRPLVEARRTAALGRLADPKVAAGITASDYASIIAENMDAIPPGSDLASRTGMILAGKFSALGLDDRAAATLDRLAGTMQPGPDRAELDTQLAALEVGRPDLASAEATLARDDEAALATSLIDRRRVIRARVLQGQGKMDDAIALLASATDDDALKLKAQLLMQRQDWHGAMSPLAELFRRLPVGGTLDAAQGAIALQYVATGVRSGMPGLSTTAEAIAPRLSDASERRSLSVLMAPLAELAAHPATTLASGI